MAIFDWASCEIRMTAGDGQYHGTKADLANIPNDADATMSSMAIYTAGSLSQSLSVSQIIVVADFLQMVVATPVLFS